MTTVTGTLTAAGGGRPYGAAVLITLVALDGAPVVGFVSPSEIVGQTAVPVGADGSWSVVLAPTASIISPRGATLYRVDETGATGRARYYISVPASGSAWVGSLRVTLPGSAPEQLTGYLPLTGGTVSGPIVLPDASPAASEAYVASHGGGGGGGGTPSGTVTSEASYGQAAAAGAATAYSRGDHTHGTPALPTPGAIGAATAGHTHAGTYDPAGTATAAVSAHEAAADPHSGYLTPAEADAIYAPLRGTGIYPPAGYGLLAMSGMPEAFMLGSGPSNNTVVGARVWIPAGVAITSLWAAVRAGGTYSASGTPNCLGLYTDPGVQVALTPDDSTLWTQPGWRGGALIGGTVAAQGTGRCRRGGDPAARVLRAGRHQHARPIRSDGVRNPDHVRTAGGRLLGGLHEIRESRCSRVGPVPCGRRPPNRGAGHPLRRLGSGPRSPATQHVSGLLAAHPRVPHRAGT